MRWEQTSTSWRTSLCTRVLVQIQGDRHCSRSSTTSTGMGFFQVSLSFRTYIAHSVFQCFSISIRHQLVFVFFQEQGCARISVWLGCRVFQRATSAECSPVAYWANQPERWHCTFLKPCSFFIVNRKAYSIFVQCKISGKYIVSMCLVMFTNWRHRFLIFLLIIL